MNHIQSLRKHIEEGTLIRGQWTGSDAQGRQTACLLAAMVPQCGEERSSAACPATVMPSWLARLTPELDDRGSLKRWPAMVDRFASLAARWHVLDEPAWLRVQYRFLAAVVREAASHTKDERALAACERVALLCDGVVTTGIVDAKAFDDARSSSSSSSSSSAAAAAEAWAAEAAAAAAAEAWAAAWAAAAAAAEAWAAEASSSAAWAAAAWAAEASSSAAWAAAAWAAEASSSAAWAAAAWAAEEAAAAAAAEAWAAEAAAAAAAEAWDRVTTALFDAIEKELA